MIRGKTVNLTADIPNQAREWRNDREIWQWARQFTLIDERSHARWLEKISSDASTKMFGVYVAYTGVGVCGLSDIDKQNQSAEFSIYIAKPYQGLGYGKDALVTLFRHGFLDMNLYRIWGETYQSNPAYKLFLSVGMKDEGIARKAYYRNGEFIDAHRIGLLRSEFHDH